MTELEKQIENEVVRYARARGIIAAKMTIPGQKGWPDHMFLAENETVLFIEFKRPGKAPYSIQEKRINKLRSRGYSVHVVDSASDGIWVIDQLIKRAVSKRILI